MTNDHALWYETINAHYDMKQGTFMIWDDAPNDMKQGSSWYETMLIMIWGDSHNDMK